MTFQNFDEEIGSDLSILDEDLYDAVIMDELSLKNLVARLAGLNERVHSTQAFAKGLLRPRTLALMRSVTSRARILARHMMNLHRSTDEIAAKRGNQIAEVLAKMSLRDNGKESTDNAHGQDQPIPSSTTERTTSTDPIAVIPPVIAEGRRPPLLLSTLAWLLENMHNPYPSASRKAIFAAANRSSMKSVNNSFETARRRIGWTKFMQKHFRSNRTLALDCAHCVFVSAGPNYPVPDHIHQDLLGVKTEAEKIYAKMLQTYDVSEKVFQSVDTLASRMTSQSVTSMASTSRQHIDATTEQNKGTRLSEHQASPRSLQTNEPHEKASNGTLNLADESTSSRPQEHTQSDTSRPQRTKTSRKRKMGWNQDNDALDQDSNTSFSKPPKRKRQILPCSPKPSSSPWVSMPSSTSIVLPTTFVSTANFEGLELESPQCEINTLHTYPNHFRSHRKRQNAMTDDDSCHSRKRARTSSFTEDYSSANTASTSVSVHPIRNFPAPSSDAPILDMGTLSGQCGLACAAESNGRRAHPEPAIPGCVTANGMCLTAGLEKISKDGSKTVGDEMDYSIHGNGLAQNSTDITDPNVDVLAMFSLADFGNDFADFPALPNFNIDWSEIPAPSLDPFLLPIDLLTTPILMPPDVSTSVGSDSSPVGSEATLVEASESPFSWFGKPLVQPDAINAESLPSAMNNIVSCLQGAA